MSALDRAADDRVRVEQALEGVLDPELGMSVVALGLIYGIEVAGTTARIRMTLTAQGCPLHAVMVEAVRAAACGVPGIERADVEVVFHPPWTPARIACGGRSVSGACA